MALAFILGQIEMITPREIEFYVNKLRKSANDFRDLRLLPAAERWDLVIPILMRVNYLVSDVMQKGALSELHPPPSNGEDYQPGMPLSISQFNRIVGYNEFQESKEHPGHYFLHPGDLSRFDDEFESIYLSGFEPHEKDATEWELSSLLWDTQRKHSFELLGYFSHACNLIASFLQVEMDELESGMGIDDEMPDTTPPLFPDIRLPTMQERLLRAVWTLADWSAKPYPLAKKTSVAVAVWDDEEKAAMSTIRSLMRDVSKSCCMAGLDLALCGDGDRIELIYRPK